LTALGAVIMPERRYQSAVIAAIVVLAGVRLLCAALAPLSFEESVYWVYSRHIAAGYFDHPPLAPILVRLGTMLFGDNEFGVRALGVLLPLPASWAIWRSAAILFKDGKIAATAALYFNLTLVVAAGSIIATPDGPLVAATALLLLTLAKLLETGRAVWWLAVGAAFGVAMLSKYTTIFFAGSILVWLLLVPDLRKWLATPWPWLAALIALAMFAPTLMWNAHHGWSSVHRQYDRLLIHDWSFKYLGEFLATQAGMATPPIFILGSMGLFRLLSGDGGSFGARALINAMVWPIVLYFIWHSLHDRVEGNWPEPIFVPFVIAAALAAERMKWHGVWAAVASWSARLAVPVGLGIAGFIYLQALFGIIPLGPIDPTAHALAVGWKELGAEMDAVRKRLGAPIVLTTDHGLNGWLAFYLPSRPPVEQINARIRYVNAPPPDPALFRGTIMYVCTRPCDPIPSLRRRFATVEPVTTLTRSRHGIVIDEYGIYRLAGPIGSPLDPP